jgi:hypothetical protein
VSIEGGCMDVMGAVWVCCVQAEGLFYGGGFMH